MDMSYGNEINLVAMIQALQTKQLRLAKQTGRCNKRAVRYYIEARFAHLMLQALGGVPVLIEQANP